jgi:ribose-phosphate pyrophosphokinase
MPLSTYELRKRLDHGSVVASAHKIFQFPVGESHINFAPTATTQIAFLTGADGNDLMALAMWADAIHRYNSELESILILPYLPGARADRGTPLGAKVYADFINSLDIDKIVTLDPHSDVAPALYDRLHVVSLDQLPIWNHLIHPDRPMNGIVFNWEVDGIIAPDLGARKRAEAVAAKLEVPIFQAMKHRDFRTGELSGFSCEPLPRTPGRHFLLVDDICDGGGTFLGLADTLNLLPENLGLWVTHGIFSNDAEMKLVEKFNFLASTDSHPGSRLLDGSWSANVHRYSVLEFLISTVKGIN